jgi:hypothetical protein
MSEAALTKIQNDVSYFYHHKDPYFLRVFQIRG